MDLKKLYDTLFQVAFIAAEGRQSPDPVKTIAWRDTARLNAINAMATLLDCTPIEVVQSLK